MKFKPFVLFTLKKNGSYGRSNAWGFTREMIIDALTRKFVERCRPIFKTKAIALSHAGKRDIIVAAKDRNPFRVRRIRGIPEKPLKSFGDMQKAADAWRPISMYGATLLDPERNDARIRQQAGS